MNISLTKTAADGLRHMAQATGHTHGGAGSISALLNALGECAAVAPQATAAQIQIALTSAEEGAAVTDFVVLAISAHHAPAIRAMVAVLDGLKLPSK